MRIPTPAAILVLLTVAASGCAGTPSMERPTRVQVEIENTHAQVTPIYLWIAEPYGESELANRQLRVAARTTALEPLMEVPAGPYVLGVRADGLERTAHAEVRPDVAFYRFILEDDGIAYQQGGGSP